MNIAEVITAPRSPLQNAYVERVIGSIRRECLDHVVIFNERHLRRVLSSYVDYHHRSRTHLSLDKDCPESRPISASQRRKNRRRSKNSVAFTIATNASPPDSSQIPTHETLSRRYAGVGRSLFSEFFDLDRGPPVMAQIAAYLI
jgi:hypothetical protein